LVRALSSFLVELVGVPRVEPASDSQFDCLVPSGPQAQRRAEHTRNLAAGV